MKKFHIAIGVTDVATSIAEYSARLGYQPVVTVAGAYALWRTPTLNFSIRSVSQASGTLRHLGWEDSSALEFSQDTDINGIVWERFSAELQAEEIKRAWPSAEYTPQPLRSRGRR